MFDQHRTLFHHLGSFYHAASDSPDVHEGPFPTKRDAWLNARSMLREAGHDASALLDLTCLPSREEESDPSAEPDDEQQPAVTFHADLAEYLR